MSLFEERTSEQNTPLNLQSILSDPVNLNFLNNLMDERIKVKEEERRRMESRTGASIDTSGFQSTSSFFTNSSRRSSERNNRAKNKLNKSSLTK